jgi:hypothetical protein
VELFEEIKVAKIKRKKLVELVEVARVVKFEATEEEQIKGDFVAGSVKVVI